MPSASPLVHRRDNLNSGQEGETRFALLYNSFMVKPSQPNSNAWVRAKSLAEKTPASRNRYVDFLRAASIFAVMIGHWILAAPYFVGNWLMPADLLSHSPWTHWLSWGFQVMPIFFMVGGYANSVSWQSAQKRGEPYSTWLTARLQRLVTPVLPVIILWNVIGIVAYASNAHADTVNIVSRFALLPAWFLIIYLFGIILVPWAYRAWERFGILSLWGLIVLAALVDFLAFGMGWQLVGWMNFFFVWLAIHQIGFAWQAGGLGDAHRLLLWALGGGIIVILLLRSGFYPIAMVPVQGIDLSNVFPPNFLLLAFAFLQGGLLLWLEPVVQRWLKKTDIWAAVLTINRAIMSILMWHVTAMVIVVVVASLLGGMGLNYFPGSLEWWQTRPLWFLAAGFVLILILPMVTPFEDFRSAPKDIPLWRLIPGILLICIGLSIPSTLGIIIERSPGIRISVFLLPFVGAALAGILPFKNWWWS